MYIYVHICIYIYIHIHIYTYIYGRICDLSMTSRRQENKKSYDAFVKPNVANPVTAITDMAALKR